MADEHERARIASEAMNTFSSLLRRSMKSRHAATSCLVVLLSIFAMNGTLHFKAFADDWPQWLGPKRDGVWRETGIIEQLPKEGPKVLWRVPVHAGYCGPAVSSGRIFLMDRVAGKMPERKRGDRSIPGVPGTERILCLNAKDGSPLWEHSYDCTYRIDYPAGPRATPVVANGRVFTLGAMGDLKCLDTSDGKLIWSVNFMTRFNIEPPVWGWSAHPLLEQDRLICLVGGSNSLVVAFNPQSGKTEWQALNARETGYAPPMIYNVGGSSELIVWHPEALTGLNPGTGEVIWSHKYPLDGKPARPEVTIATPRFDGRRLFVTQYYKGSAMFELTGNPPAATLLWNRHGKAGVDFSDGLHTVMSTPVLKDGFIYGICGMGELRCLDAATGDRKWETYAATGGKEAPLANAFIVAQADRYWIWNDQGELILAKLNPAGFEEISRASILTPQENTRGRDVLWCHPAFAERCAFVHNGKELVCVSLKG